MIKKITLALLAVVAIAGCQEYDSAVDGASNGGLNGSNVVSFTSVGISSRVTEIEGADGVTSFEWESGDKVGISTYGLSDDYFNVGFEVNVDSSGKATFTAIDGEITLPSKVASSVTFYAYYPYDASMSDGDQIWVNTSADAASSGDNDELFIASTTLSAAELTSVKSIALQFSHILSKAEFNFTFNYYESADLTNFDFLLCEVITRQSYDICGTIKSSDPATTLQVEIAVDSENKSATASIYLHPSSLTQNSYFILDFGSDTYCIPYSESVESGKKYTYNDNIGAPDIIYANGLYEIYTANGFRAFADLVNGKSNTSAAFTYGEGFASFNTYNLGINGLLMNSIDLQGSESNQWTPIGYYSGSWWGTNCSFDGTFDGGENTISGLYINSDSGTNSQALFGYSNYGTIKNLTVEGSVTSTGNYTAGVVGYGSATNCINRATISGGDENTGGITGDGTVTNSLNEGKVSGASNVGGVTGSGSAYNCGNIGEVIGSDNRAGGIAGNCNTVSNCYNTGSVNGELGVGGIAGDSRANITNCYNMGAVSGRDFVGGVIGQFNAGDGTLTNCYYNSQTSGASAGVGVINDGGTDTTVGKITSEMTDGTFATTLGDAFKEDYAAPNQINGGYPILTWQ